MEASFIQQSKWALRSGHVQITPSALAIWQDKSDNFGIGSERAGRQTPFLMVLVVRAIMRILIGDPL